MVSALLLLLPPLLLRLVPGRCPSSSGGSDERWRGADTVALGIAVAILTPLGAFWFAAFHLGPAPLTSADFQSYCGALAGLREGTVAHWYPMRSVAAGLLPGVLSGPLGLLEGFVVASLLSWAGVLAGIWIWGRALHGRVAATVAAVLACAVAPLVLVSRHLSFYPEITASMVLCAASGAWAARRRTRLSLVLAGCGVGLALLADARGLIWGGAVFALGVAVAFGRGWRRSPARLALLLLPVVLSYGLGRWAYAPTFSLEVQLANSVRDTAGGGREYLPEFRRVEGYRWGYSAPWRIPVTLARLVRASRVSDRVLAVEERTLKDRARHLEPWLPVMAVAGIIALVALRRRPWLLGALVTTSAPFLISLKGAGAWEVTIRYLALGLPVLPVWGAVAWAALAEGGRPILSPRIAAGGAWPLLRPVLHAAVAMLLVAGVIPSFLSPVAPWRAPFESVPEALETFRYVSEGGRPPQVPLHPLCLSGIRRDRERGRPAGSRLHPYTLPARNGRHGGAARP